MKERPILFSGPMVRALLEGRKTQTRRAVKLREFGRSDTRGYDWTFRDRRALWNDVSHARLLEMCPYGAPGDRLWVRETWNTFDPDPGPEGDLEVVGASRFASGKRAPYSGCQGPREIRWTTAYRADGELEHPKDGRAMWRPSIHMPRWASRLTLEVTEVRVQRLQDISGADAIAEGCLDIGQSAQANFAALWCSINGEDSWEANPWAWAISFKRVTP